MHTKRYALDTPCLQLEPAISSAEVLVLATLAQGTIVYQAFCLIDKEIVWKIFVKKDFCLMRFFPK